MSAGVSGTTAKLLKYCSETNDRDVPMGVIVEEGVEFFSAVPSIRISLKCSPWWDELAKTITATTLSGGEAQR